MTLSKDFQALLLFCLFFSHIQTIQDACQSKQVPSMIDISTSKIVKTSVYEYKVQNYDNPTNITRNQRGQFIFQGNFSKITLLNKALKRQYTYQAKQIILRVPSTHFYSKNKSAQAQLQIIYHIDRQNRQNRHTILTMTQLYLVTKFLNKVETSICKQVNEQNTNGTIFKVSKLLKIIQKTPVLMYQGSRNIYPCRDDVLCMVRKQFALISEEDINCLKLKMKIQATKQVKSQKYSQKSLLQVGQIVQNNQKIDL